MRAGKALDELITDALNFDADKQLILASRNDLASYILEHLQGESRFSPFACHVPIVEVVHAGTCQSCAGDCCVTSIPASIFKTCLSRCDGLMSYLHQPKRS